MSSLPQTTPLPASPALPPNPTTTLAAAVSSATTISHLKQLHAQILRSKLDRPNSLHLLLLKLALASSTLSPPTTILDYALSVFSHIPSPHPALSNKILREFSRRSDSEKALLVYGRMRREGSSVDRFSFPALLKAAPKAGALEGGRFMTLV